MTIQLSDAALYAGFMFILFMTPGPVWVAILTRTLAQGFHGAWPLALGVVVGDIIWPLVAILGMSWVVSTYGGAMVALRWMAMGLLLYWGVMMIISARAPLSENKKLTRPGVLSGFAAGFAVIMSNPKAILFYLGILPEFFDFAAITKIDMAVIVALSALVPFIGNLILSAMVLPVRKLLSSPTALYRMNITSGLLFILVGLSIGFL